MTRIFTVSKNVCYQGTAGEPWGNSSEFCWHKSTEEEMKVCVHWGAESSSTEKPLWNGMFQFDLTGYYWTPRRTLQHHAVWKSLVNHIYSFSRLLSVLLSYPGSVFTISFDSCAAAQLSLVTLSHCSHLNHWHWWRYLGVGGKLRRPNQMNETLIRIMKEE